MLEEQMVNPISKRDKPAFKTGVYRYHGNLCLCWGGGEAALWSLIGPLRPRWSVNDWGGGAWCVSGNHTGSRTDGEERPLVLLWLNRRGLHWERKRKNILYKKQKYITEWSHKTEKRENNTLIFVTVFVVYIFFKQLQ